MESHQVSAQPSASSDEEDFDYEPAAAPEAPQVSSFVAIIRIIAVLAMGLCVSFGLFLMLAGLKGVLIGVPLVLLAIPCYYGMQFAEKLALRAEGRTAE